MNERTVAIRLEGKARVFQPGDALAGDFRVTPPPEDARAVEWSILWYTVGKGDEDLAIHDFHRWSSDDEPLDLERPRRFSTVLPSSPLTYDGVILRIRWCVRVRVFLPRGRELVGEHHFRLGRIPPVRPPRAARPTAAKPPTESELE